MKKTIGFTSIFCISAGAMISSGLFVLIGTKDMRRLHLRALAAIAQVVQADEFEAEWDRSRNHRELRDLFHTSKRKRNS